MTTIDTRHDIHIEGAPHVDAVFTDGRDPHFSVQLRAGSAMPALTVSVDEKDAERFAERLAAAADSILETLRSRRLATPHGLLMELRDKYVCGACGLLGSEPGPCPRCAGANGRERRLAYPDNRQAEACEEVARHGIGVTALDEHGQEVKVS